jgi:hypothetical protein
MELYQLRIIVAYAIATLFGSLLTFPFLEFFGTRQGLQWLGVVPRKGGATRSGTRLIVMSTIVENANARMVSRPTSNK